MAVFVQESLSTVTESKCSCWVWTDVMHDIHYRSIVNLTTIILADSAVVFGQKQNKKLEFCRLPLWLIFSSSYFFISVKGRSNMVVSVLVFL